MSVVGRRRRQGSWVARDGGGGRGSIKKVSDRPVRRVPDLKEIPMTSYQFRTTPHRPRTLLRPELRFSDPSSGWTRKMVRTLTFLTEVKV